MGEWKIHPRALGAGQTTLLCPQLTSCRFGFLASVGSQVHTPSWIWRWISKMTLASCIILMAFEGEFSQFWNWLFCKPQFLIEEKKSEIVFWSGIYSTKWVNLLTNKQTETLVWLWGQSPWLSAVRECVACTEFLRGKLTSKGWRISNFLTLRIPLSLDEQEPCNDLPILPLLRPQRNGCVVLFSWPKRTGCRNLHYQQGEREKKKKSQG